MRNMDVFIKNFYNFLRFDLKKNFKFCCLFSSLVNNLLMDVCKFILKVFNLCVVLSVI